MKIHVLIKNTLFTGGRKETFRHAHELARRGHDVTIWTCQNPKIGWMDVQVPVREFHLDELERLPAADICLFERPRFAAPLLRAKVGIPVHFCQGYEGAAIDSRIGAIWKAEGLVRGLPEMWNQWQRRRMIERGYQLPTVKIAVHQHLCDLIARRFGQQAYLVPNSLPAGFFHPPRMRSFAGSTVLVVGPTRTAWKRVADALEAVRLLKQARPGLKLIRVAQHPMDEGERKLALTDEYHSLLGPQAMADLYRRADVLAIASDATEGFGLPVVEAMACGMPVVATDIPAFRTFARPDDYAHFVPVGQPAVLAQTLGNLLDNVDERRRLSARGVQVAEAYQPERSFQAMHDTLLDIVEKHWHMRAA